jgi:hypothetical protein
MSSFGTGIMANISIEAQFCRGLPGPALTSIKPTDISFDPLADREIRYAPLTCIKTPCRRHH